MLCESVEELELEAKGNTMEQALNRIFAQVRPKISKKYQGQAIIQIDPKDMKIASAEESVSIEKFMFFFFPREKSTFKLKVVLTVQIRRIDLKQITVKRNMDNISILKQIFNKSKIEV